MTPADLAMKWALEEGEREGSSPLISASTDMHHVNASVDNNLRASNLEWQKSSDTESVLLSGPYTPRPLCSHPPNTRSPHPRLPTSETEGLALAQKQSFVNFSRGPFTSSPAAVPSASTPPPLHLSASQKFVPTFPHHAPPFAPPQSHVSLPSIQHDPYSPSLSSTVDTIDSTPTHSPLHHQNLSFEKSETHERPCLGEPLRTKRRFASFKQAKRLPHHSFAGSGPRWEVHAALINIGYDEGHGRGDTSTSDSDTSTGTPSKSSAPIVQRRDVSEDADEPASDGVEKTEEAGGRSPSFQSQHRHGNPEHDTLNSSPLRQRREWTANSTLSLSKFRFPFPPPPAAPLAAPSAFGPPVTELTPTSPAVLGLRGTSFDVVNPHESLILGVKSFETPAELDALLDDYFDPHTPVALSSRCLPNEMPSSQQTIDPLGDAGRPTRVLYNDADSARREIMRLPSTGLSSEQMSPAQRPVKQSLDPDTSAVPTPSVLLPGDANDAIAAAPEDQDIDAGFRVTGADRASSVYPSSERSDPFDLADDLETRRNRRQYDKTALGSDREQADVQHITTPKKDNVVYAKADFNNLEHPDSTVSEIVNNYRYRDQDDGASKKTQQANHSASSLAENWPLPTGQSDTDDWPLPTPEGARGNRMKRSETAWSLCDSAEADVLDGVSQYRARQNSRGTVTKPAIPLPQLPALEEQAMTTRPTFARHPSDFTDVPSSDRTYGNTGQLLNLTPRPGGAEQSAADCPGPRESAFPPFLSRIRRHAESTENQSPVTRRPALHRWPTFQDDADDEDEPISANPMSRYDGGEDKENMPPEHLYPPLSMERIIARLNATPPSLILQPSSMLRGTSQAENMRALRRTSSQYSADRESDWETQPNESRDDINHSNFFGRPSQDEEAIVRPSEDSYANTSVVESSNRFSFPHSVQEEDSSMYFETTQQRSFVEHARPRASPAKRSLTPKDYDEGFRPPMLNGEGIYAPKVAPPIRPCIIKDRSAIAPWEKDEPVAPSTTLDGHRSGAAPATPNVDRSLVAPWVNNERGYIAEETKHTGGKASVEGERARSASFSTPRKLQKRSQDPAFHEKLEKLRRDTRERRRSGFKDVKVLTADAKRSAKPLQATYRTPSPLCRISAAILGEKRPRRGSDASHLLRKSPHPSTPTPTPSRRSGRDFRGSDNIFGTVVQGDQASHRSLIVSRPTQPAAATLRPGSSSRSVRKTDGVEEIELSPLPSTATRTHPTAAMQGQTSLRALHLSSSARDVSNRFSTRKSSAALVADSANWDMRPNFTPKSALGAHYPPGAWEAANSAEAEARNDREHKKTTRIWAILFLSTPITATLLGIGLMDWFVRRRTQERFEGFTKMQRRRGRTWAALWLVLIMVAIGLGIAGAMWNA